MLLTALLILAAIPAWCALSDRRRRAKLYRRSMEMLYPGENVVTAATGTRWETFRYCCLAIVGFLMLSIFVH